MICRAYSADPASTITAPCWMMVSTRSRMTLYFAIAAPRIRALVQGGGSIAEETGNIKRQPLKTQLRGILGFASKFLIFGGMSANCCHDDVCVAPRQDARFRRVLWVVLAINAVMFCVEVGAGLASGSASLQADALDFLADASNYAISLFVVGMALQYRATAALIKGATMGLFGLWVIGTIIWHAVSGTVPEPITMGVVGLAALIANAAVFGLLWAYRGGDSNMRSIWICSRNDVIGNLAVLLAAAGVFGTGTGWPDVIVAAIMAGLALWGAKQIIQQARGELRRVSGPQHA
jgi:Co/Zn/Cd efflux system component